MLNLLSLEKQNDVISSLSLNKDKNLFMIGGRQLLAIYEIQNLYQEDHLGPPDIKLKKNLRTRKKNLE